MSSAIQTIIEQEVRKVVTKLVKEAKYPTAYEYNVRYDLRDFKTDPEAPIQSSNIHNLQLGFKRFVQSDTQKPKDMQVILNNELNQFKTDFATALAAKKDVSVRLSGSMGGGREAPKTVRADAIKTIRFQVTKISSRGEHIPVSVTTWDRDTNTWATKNY